MNGLTGLLTLVSRRRWPSDKPAKAPARAATIDAAYRARVKTMKQERVQGKAARAEPKKKEIDLAPEANEAFGLPEQDDGQPGDSGELDATVPNKPKRIRKRKDPSERTNRRHTKEKEPVVEKPLDQAAEKMDRWQDQEGNRFDERRDRDRDDWER